MKAVLPWFYLVILIGFWAFGLATGHTYDGAVHVLLLAAMFLVMSQLIARQI